jgi:hypothetical protein
MPKRSASMPKRDAKNVLISGWCTVPPSPSALNSRSACASLSTFLPAALPPDSTIENCVESGAQWRLAISAR